MKRPTANGLAFVVLVLAPPAHAQISGGVTLATDYRLRGVSLTDRRGVVAAHAAYDNGVLTLRIPLAAHAKPRKIAISGGTPKQLTA